MMAFIGRRLLVLLPTLFLVSVFVFGIQLLIPGDVALVMAGEDRSAENLAYIRELYHLNDPFWRRYLYWISGAVRGDLGVSTRSAEAVSHLIALKLPITLQLSFLGLMTGLCISIPMGVFAATRQNSLWDLGASFFALVGQSVPTFWLGYMLILFVSVRMGWLPASGYVRPTEDFWQNIKTVLMPSFVLGLEVAGVLFRHTRSAMLEVLGADYIRTARTKGLSRPRVIFRHGLRNALIPVVTMTTLLFGRLLGGAVLTETVFSIPGMGKLIVDAVFNRDFLTVEGVVLCSSFLFIFLNLLADIAYFWLDPQLRFKEMH